MVLHLPDDTFCLANGLCQQATCNASLGCETQAVLNCCGNNQTEPGETCDDGNNTDGDGCSSTCQTEGEDCLEEGKWVGDVYWQKAEITANATCLGEYYTHSDALSACSALGPGWSLPTISMANALLASMSASEEDEWFPLSGNGGTSCQQMQAGGNGVWWLNEHNGQSGGAAIFCGSGGCYTTGTQMGDSYLYHVRCVKLGCTQGSTAPGCPGVCESAEEPVGPGTIYIADNGANAIWKYDLADEQKTLMLGNEQGWPHGITYNPTANTLYWSLTLGQSIRTYNLATGASTSFGTPGSHPSALSFDPVGQKLYWTETVGSALRRSAPDGSNIETLIDGLSFSVGLQVIPAEGKMYWSEESLNRIRRANLDGSNIENLIVTGAGKPRGIEVYGESIYWADRDSQTVRVRAKAGGGVITLASGFSFVQDVGIPEGGDTIYAIDDGISQPGVIYTIPINGGAKTPLPGLMGNPKHLVFVP
jgi:cysteine-rich repeat protein